MATTNQKLFPSLVTHLPWIMSAGLKMPVGESWSQCASTQVRLYWNDAVRYAGVYKSPFLEQKAVPYQITHDGVRSIAQQTS